MTPKQFVYWLQGFAELGDVTSGLLIGHCHCSYYPRVILLYGKYLPILQQRPIL